MICLFRKLFRFFKKRTPSITPLIKTLKRKRKKRGTLKKGEHVRTARRENSFFRSRALSVPKTLVT